MSVIVDSDPNFENELGGTDHQDTKIPITFASRTLTKADRQRSNYNCSLKKIFHTVTGENVL